MGAKEWTAERVLAASNAWVWIPSGSRVLETEEYRLIDRPAYLHMPAAVRSFVTTREVDDLIDTVIQLVADWGRGSLGWQVSDATRPAGLEEALLARGGRVEERMDVLALPIGGGVPDVPIPPDVEIRQVNDEAGLRHYHRVAADAFGDGPLTDEQVAADLEELRVGLPEGPVGRVVAYVEGQPAGAGGYTLAGDVCRLWGGSTHHTLRGRGAYRAVLLERLRLARERGATLGLSHGRVDTSSPILRRNGFVRYGENREIVLDVPA